MSRKDTILIAVLINCALLVVLFMMAIWQILMISVVETGFLKSMFVILVGAKFTR